MGVSEKIELSVVILCFHSGDILEEFVAQLAKEIEELQITYELLLVANYYDHEDDPTPSIARQIENSNSRCRVIAEPKKGRMGWDMRSGLSAAKGEFIAVIDGDGQMPVSDIPIVYKIISTGDFDLVKTYRSKRFDGFYRRTISKAFNFLFGIIFSPTSPVKDVNSKPKIITQKALHSMNLVSNDWFTDAEIMIEANRLNLRICDIATVFYENQRRSSFIRPSTIFEFMFNMIYYRIKLK